MSYGMYWMYCSYKNQIIVLESLPGFTCKIQVIKRERDESNDVKLCPSCSSGKYTLFIKEETYLNLYWEFETTIMFLPI